MVPPFAGSPDLGSAGQGPPHPETPDMSRRHARTIDPLAGTALPDTADLGTLTIRELLQALASLEDKLTHLHPLAAQHSGPLPNPEQQQVLMCQRALVRELRSRRMAMRRVEPVAAVASRPKSAAWPPPPWH